MFFNQNSTTFGGNVGNIAKTTSGLIRFGVCQTTSTKVDGKWIDSENWINVVLTEKQTETYASRLQSGDEILITGDLRVGEYEGKKTVTVFCKRIEGHVPGVVRKLASLVYKIDDASKQQLKGMDAATVSSQIATALGLSFKPQQPAPQAVQSSQPAQTNALLTPEMAAALQLLMASQAQPATATNQHAVVPQPAVATNQQVITQQPANQLAVQQPVDKGFPAEWDSEPVPVKPEGAVQLTPQEQIQALAAQMAQNGSEFFQGGAQ
jgi:single-stranded DNA-binding protein